MKKGFKFLTLVVIFFLGTLAAVPGHRPRSPRLQAWGVVTLSNISSIYILKLPHLLKSVVILK